MPNVISDKRTVTQCSCVSAINYKSLWRAIISASLYFSKRGAYWDRLCRDVVGRWLVGCHARALWPNGASYAYSYYGTLIGNPTPGIQWYKFRPLGWPLTGEWAPREALFVKLLWPLVFLKTLLYDATTAWTTTLRHAAVPDAPFDNLNAVVLEVVIEPDVTNSVVFHLWLVNSLLQPSIESQNLNTTTPLHLTTHL